MNNASEVGTPLDARFEGPRLAVPMGGFTSHMMATGGSNESFGGTADSMMRGVFTKSQSMGVPVPPYTNTINKDIESDMIMSNKMISLP